MEILLTLSYLALFNFLIYRYRKLQLNGFRPVVTNVLFNLKFVTGIFIWFIYTFYYTDVQNNDVHKFYSDALIIRDVAKQNPSAFFDLMVTGNTPECCGTDSLKNWTRNFDEAPINENRTIIRLNALLMFISFKTYFVHIVVMCFLSLLGWVLIFNSVFKCVNKHPSLLALVILILPSVLFWTSGVLKEPILVFGLGVFMYGLLGFAAKRSLGSGLSIIAGILILLAIKFYVLACLIPALIAFMLYKNRDGIVFNISKYMALYVVLLIAAFNIQHVIPRINPMQMLVNKQEHSVKEAIYFKAGSRIDIPEMTPDAFSIIKTAPVGIWNTVIRPYLWEGKNPMMLACALENLLILGLLIITILFYKRDGTGSINLVLFLLFFSLSYFAIIGICTPALGNLVRYKAPLLPFFLLAFVLLVDEDEITGKLTVIERLKRN